MAAFALATSLTPGPVNVVALSSGARHGWRASLPFVFGATAGFTLLLVLVGLAMQQAARAMPLLAPALRWAGGAFLLAMAWRLGTDRGRLDVAASSTRHPSLLAGAAMQWLNPKAWLATLSGMAVHASGQVGLFAAIYFVVCFVSIAAWAVAGSALAAMLADARRLRRLNIAMAALLAASAVVMLRE
jgi:threonine/homoserine/homoserine lactone efflux protein